jgi:hypothetical protein
VPNDFSKEVVFFKKGKARKSPTKHAAYFGSNELRTPSLSGKAVQGQHSWPSPEEVEWSLQPRRGSQSMSSAQASPGANSKNNKKNSVFIICIVQLIVSCIRRQLVALKKLEMFRWSAQGKYVPWRRARCHRRFRRGPSLCQI